ncbi:hypothetical protein [Ruminococcus sp. Marseille-P6503]|uniref:hypothetical protein n=1 Tax=Ruminococcus sp. Marseille-P6503 TaxID=2364796 RepID=UPI000F52808F|nr:hypothetical protein [Ruminococcus sp. Marseille-P6503]
MFVISDFKNKLSKSAADFIVENFLSKISDKKLEKDLEKFSEQYFLNKFENCSAEDEFDYEAVKRFLFENIDQRIPAIFYESGQEGRASLKERLIKDAIARGHGSPNTIRSYCTAIIDFIGECIYDTISSEGKWIASQVVSSVREHYEENKKQTEHILEELRYYGSFEELIDNMNLPQMIAENPFSYLNPKIRFYGRITEQQKISEFMNDDRSFLFWSVTGRGGMGKSKFALHICREYEKLGWKAVWANSSKLSKIIDFNGNVKYNKPLLVVCDYAGEYIDKIREYIIDISNRIRGFKCRLLLIERSDYKNTSNASYIDNWYSRLYSSHNRDTIKNMEYLEVSLDLDEYILKDEEMKAILDDFSDKKLSDKEKENIINFVKKRLGGTSEKYDARCLFLLFTADACLHHLKYNNWDSEKLMLNYINRTKVRWKSYLKSNDAVCKCASKLLAFATAAGGISFDEDYKSVPAEYINNLRNALGYDSDIYDSISFLNVLCEKNTEDLRVEPMLPDIVGEYFFISEFRSLPKNKKTEWREMLLSDEYREYFLNFLGRCISDWHKDELKSVYDGFINCCYENNILDNGICSIIVNTSYYYSDPSDYEVYEKVLKEIKTEFGYYCYAIFLCNEAALIDKLEESLNAAEKIKSEVLSNYKTAKTAEIYAKALVNAAVKMKTAEEILEITDKIKSEVLSEYDTVEIAEIYVKVLASAIVEMQTAEEIMEIADRMKSEVLSEYNTAEITKVYAKVLVGATLKMQTAEEIMEIADRIKNEVLFKYNTAEIAEIYVKVLAGAIVKMQTAEEIMEIADRIKNEVLFKYNTAEIAEVYVKVLASATLKMQTAEEIMEIANRIKSEVLSEYNTAEIAEIYVKVLAGAIVKMQTAEEIMEIADRIKNEVLFKYNTAEIAEVYVKVLASATLKMQTAEEIMEIANRIKSEVLSEYNTVGIAKVYAAVLVGATEKMQTAEEILEIADRIKSEVLSNYKTAETAEAYAATLANATGKLFTYKERLRIAEKIVFDVLSIYPTYITAVMYYIALESAEGLASNQQQKSEISEKITKCENDYCELLGEYLKTR